jgi:hypothetical protein
MFLQYKVQPDKSWVITQVTLAGNKKRRDTTRNVWFEKSTAAATSIDEDPQDSLSITRQIPTKLCAPVITPSPLITQFYRLFYTFFRLLHFDLLLFLLLTIQAIGTSHYVVFLSVE